MAGPHDDIYGMLHGIPLQDRVPGGIAPPAPMGPMVGPPRTGFPVDVCPHCGAPGEGGAPHGPDALGRGGVQPRYIGGVPSTGRAALAQNGHSPVGSSQVDLAGRRAPVGTYTRAHPLGGAHIALFGTPVKEMPWPTVQEPEPELEEWARRWMSSLTPVSIDMYLEEVQLRLDGLSVAKGQRFRSIAHRLGLAMRLLNLFQENFADYSGMWTLGERFAYYAQEVSACRITVEAFLDGIGYEFLYVIWALFRAQWKYMSEEQLEDADRAALQILRQLNAAREKLGLAPLSPPPHGSFVSREYL